MLSGTDTARADGLDCQSLRRMIDPRAEILVSLAQLAHDLHSTLGRSSAGTWARRGLRLIWGDEGCELRQT